MALLTQRDDESEEGLRARLQQAREDLAAGKLSREDYDALSVRLTAQLALLGVQPTRDANAPARLADLDYLRAKGWITQEEYDARRKEILGQE